MLDTIHVSFASLPYIVLNTSREEGCSLLRRFTDDREHVGLLLLTRGDDEAFVYPAPGAGRGIARRIVRMALEVSDRQGVPNPGFSGADLEAYRGLAFATPELSPSGTTMIVQSSR